MSSTSPHHALSPVGPLHRSPSLLAYRKTRNHLRAHPYARAPRLRLTSTHAARDADTSHTRKVLREEDADDAYPPIETTLYRHRPIGPASAGPLSSPLYAQPKSKCRHPNKRTKWKCGQGCEGGCHGRCEEMCRCVCHVNWNDGQVWEHEKEEAYVDEIFGGHIKIGGAGVEQGVRDVVLNQLLEGNGNRTLHIVDIATATLAVHQPFGNGHTMACSRAYAQAYADHYTYHTSLVYTGRPAHQAAHQYAQHFLPDGEGEGCAMYTPENAYPNHILDGSDHGWPTTQGDHLYGEVSDEDSEGEVGTASSSSSLISSASTSPARIQPAMEQYLCSSWSTAIAA